MDYTYDFTRKKIKIAKFFRDAKAQVIEEEYINKAEFQLKKVCLVAEEEEIVIEALLGIPSNLSTYTFEMVILTSARASFARPSEKERPLEIIVSDYCPSLVRGEIIKGKRLMAMNSNFSWLLSGPVQGLWLEVAQTLCQRIEVLPAEDGTLNNILPRFWELNLLEMSDFAERENESLFNKTVSFDEIEGRFTVQLLWKQDRPTLPSNLVLC